MARAAQDRQTARVSVRLRLLGALGVAALSFASPAHASYDATFAGQCCYLTLESGETAGGQYFELRNSGTEPWSSTDFNLGTREPENRSSAFAVPSWLNPGRPAHISPQAVLPGQTGRFTFAVRAPSVGVTTVFREHFQALREGVTWTGPVMFLDYTVLPSLPPTVGFTSVPAQVARGAALEVTADATDNRAVEHVEFSVGETTVAGQTTDGKSYRAQVPTDALASGPQTVVVKAVDRVGNFATATAGFAIAPPPGAVDRDGDGVLPGADCDDTNSAIHPGAAEVPGNGVDDDCSGGDAAGTVAATVLNNWVAGRRTTRITALKARGVPAGATIETRCSGGGCTFKLKRLAVPKAGDVDLRTRYFKRSRLRVGAVVEVRILAPNRIGKVARFTIRRGR